VSLPASTNCPDCSELVRSKAHPRNASRVALATHPHGSNAPSTQMYDVHRHRGITACQAQTTKPFVCEWTQLALQADGPEAAAADGISPEMRQRLSPLPPAPQLPPVLKRGPREWPRSHETNRTHLALFGLQHRAFCPYLTAIDSVAKKPR
jgi:hypothetical protein